MTVFGSVRDALIEAETLKLKIMEDESEAQAALARLRRHALEMQDIVWRLKYELETRGVIDVWGDPIDGGPPAIDVAPARARAAIVALERRKG